MPRSAFIEPPARGGPPARLAALAAGQHRGRVKEAPTRQFTVSPDTESDVRGGVDRPGGDAFRADDVTGTRAVRSGFIQLAAQGALALLTIGSTMVLARLLTPEDYGLLAVTTSFTVVIAAMRDLGLPMATVHREHIDHAQVSALFWITLAWNIVLAGVLVGLASIVAGVYGDPRLAPILRVSAIGMLASGLTAQQESLVVRRMRFGSLALIDIGATLAAVAAAVTAATRGAGYWALVLQMLVFSLSRAAAIWLTSVWRPGSRGLVAAIKSPEVRALLAYGRHYTGFQVVGQLTRRLDRLLVGYFGGAASVGLYDNALRWSQFPLQHVFPPLLPVAVSGLSRAQDDPRRYRAACRRAFVPTLGLLLPVMAFMAAEARSVILVLLGEKWLGAVPLLRVLCIARFAGSVSRLTNWVFLSRGETRRQLRWALMYAPVMSVAVVLGIGWGAMGVVVGIAVATWLLALPRVAFCLSGSPLRVREFLAIAARPALASCGATGFLIVAVSALPDHAPLVHLTLAGGIFGAAYVALWMAIPGGRAAAGEVVGLLAELRRRPTKGTAAAAAAGATLTDAP